MQGKDKRRQGTFLTPEFLKRQQALLEVKLKKYQELARVAQRGISVGVEDIGGEELRDILDRASAEVERSRNIQDLHRYYDVIRQIRGALSLAQALQKGEQGGDEEYGRCSDCDMQIPQKRLEIIPWASLCAPCQRKRESITVNG